MRDTATSKRRSLWLAAIPVSIALGTAVIVPATTTQAQSSSLAGLISGSTDYLEAEDQQRTPIRTEERPVIQGLPHGVSVERVTWLTDRHLELEIRSAAMPAAPVKVQILLARDWHSSPNRTFPEVWALDGMRATDTESGWVAKTNIISQFADKNVNVIMPIGGQSSFYSDWLQESNGVHYMWETFLINELIPVLRNGYRSNGERAVFGLSMGGTAAINLAERHPDLFKFAGSFSGYLDTTSPGMPASITAAQQDAGGFSSEAMWGPYGSQQWIDHDPKLGVENLKGIKVYVSAGSGMDDYGQPGSVANGPANAAGKGLEVLSRMTTETFKRAAEKKGIDVTAVFRPSGVHDWPYWQFELTQAWPHMAKALNLSDEDKGATCVAIGAIAEATRTGSLGACLTNEYDVAGGKVQDFAQGRAYWSPETGAFGLYGRINARYTELGGPASWLGFPLSDERAAANGGRFVEFHNGNIYWTPTLGAVAVPRDIVIKWGEHRWEHGFLGYPTGDAVGEAGGFIQQFQGGTIVRNAKNENYIVHGAIGAKYAALGGATSPLGYPVSDEIPLEGGAFQRFEKGNIYWSPTTGAAVIYYGAIFDAWGAKGWERGEYGYPTKDQASIAAGGETVTFQHGTISQIMGVIREEKN